MGTQAEEKGVERQAVGLQSTSPEFQNPVGRRKGVPGAGSMGKAVRSQELPSPQILNGFFFPLFNAPIASLIMTAWKGTRDLGRRAGREK